MSAMDLDKLSLDDIIKKKKVRKDFAGKGKGLLPKATGRVAKTKVVPKKHGGLLRTPVIDARNKIIQKHRSEIHDARDKLAQIARQNGDVRQKLLRKGITSKSSINRRHFSNDVAVVRHKPVKRPYNPPYTEHDIRMESSNDYMPALRRTVKNDVSYVPRMPPLSTFKHVEDSRQQMIETSWSTGVGADPFDCYEVPQTRPFDVSEPKNLNRQLTIQVRPHPTQKSIRRVSSDQPYRYTDMPHVQRNLSSYDRFRESNGQLSYEMRSRLHQSPDTSQSMGIFSNPYASRIEETKQKPGYRIVVSNLHNSVTQNDVKELFEDIGQLLEARLVKTGVAEVIFAEMKDAESAVETYHNRQLDGQPMKCLLVNPRPTGKPTAPAIRSSRSNSSKSGKVEIDIDALHSVLFRRH